jgi:RNA polymerase sigma-70 factor (ECF subfamily)
LTSEAFTAAVIRMTPTLYRVARGQLMIEADQQDAVQEAIRRSWEKRGSLKNERYLQTWVIRILLNVCHDIQRHGKREIPVHEFPDLPAETPESVDLRGALFRLKEKERVPVILHYIEGYDVKHVAEILKIPSGSVKTRLMRARAHLRDILNEEALEGNEE